MIPQYANDNVQYIFASTQPRSISNYKVITINRFGFCQHQMTDLLFEDLLLFFDDFA